MIFDFLVINTSGVFLVTVLFNILYLNDKKLYLILITDIILNTLPIITIIIIIFYLFKIYIFKYIKENIINLIVFLTINYFIFGFIIYGIYNNFNIYIWKYLLSNLYINLIIYVIGLKILRSKYNLVGDTLDSEKIY